MAACTFIALLLCAPNNYCQEWDKLKGKTFAQCDYFALAYCCSQDVLSYLTYLTLPPCLPPLTYLFVVALSLGRGALSLALHEREPAKSVSCGSSFKADAFLVYSVRQKSVVVVV